ncbi:MAG TPA: PilN domain-containing protein [Methylomirabilota bacterium]|nr:PilN domain-containing protein [Methylomirabilota bacterium]
MIPTSSVIGLNFSDSRLSVVTVSRGRVTQAFTLEQGEELAQLFKAELEARKVKTRNLCVSVPRAWAVVKEIELPPAVGENLDQMVQFELERHLPFPLEDALYVWKPTAPPLKDSPRRILIVAVERRIIDQVCKLADDLGLRLLSIDLAPHALLSLVEPPRRGTRIAALHLVDGSADLTFLEGRELRLSRSAAVTDSTDEALAREVQRSLTLLRWNGLDAIWLSSDAAQPPSSPDLSAFGTNAEPPPYKRDVLRNLPLLAEQIPLGLGLPAFAAAFGRRPQLNLLPIERRPRRPHWSHVATAASFAVTVVLGVGVLLSQNYVQQRQLSRLNQTLTAIDPEVKAVEKLSAELDRSRKLLATLKEVERGGIQPLAILKDLTELVPQEAWLTTLTMDTKGVELTGQATVANQLIPILENSSLLERVEFASPVTKGRDKEQFRIRAGWEQKLVAPPPAAKPGRKDGAKTS